MKPLLLSRPFDETLEIRDTADVYGRLVERGLRELRLRAELTASGIETPPATSLADLLPDSNVYELRPR